MKPLFFHIIYLLITLFLFCFKLIAYLFELLCRELMLYKRFFGMRLHKLNKKGKAKKKTAGTIPRKVEMKQDKEENIMGKTHTQYIQKPPATDSDGCFHHQPLEVINEIEQESEIDPQDIETSSSPAPPDVLSEEDPDLSPDGDAYPSELSSGVTIEELSETYQTLSRSDTNREQETKARDVLSKVDGTVLMDFFMLQKECSVIAKRLMEKDIVEKNNGNKSIVDNKDNTLFSMSTYI